MIYNINILWPNINLEKIYDWRAVMGDSIYWNFTIYGINLTNYAIRGEMYDLNVSNRMANVEGGSESAPEIVVTYASDEYSSFTAHLAAGLSAAMQPFTQVEFSITSPIGDKYTLMQQPIAMSFERIIWSSETQPVFEQDDEDDGEDPLF